MMNTKKYFVLFSLFVNLFVFGQKINTDSLLVVANKQLSIEKNYPETIKLSRLGIQLAPTYLDFHLLLGKAYWLTKQPDSARYYFKHVIEKNTQYKEAFSYLTRLEIEEHNAESALNIIDQAIALYPEEKDFEILKLQVLALDNEDDRSLAYLKELVEKYPEDPKLKQQWVALKTKTSSNRVGVNYTYTSFNRDGLGPWHLVSLEYIRERKKISLIGRINYADRRAFSTSIISGVQYEIDSYFVTNSKSYSYANIGYSDNTVFPKIRLAYSYYRSFENGWEADAGIRYTETTNFKLYTAALGIGKYVGSYWFNLKTYLLFFENKIYPATTATTRYYFNTKYDYVSMQAGFGTSPDERVTLGEFQERFSLRSYRIGAGYHRLVWNSYCLGVQATVNRQEYKIDNYQNELNLSLSLQYKF
jgi:YaiO family outer membrane protein